MATHAIYDKARASFINGDLNLTSNNIKIALVHIGAGHYVVDLANDQFLNPAIVSGDILVLSGNLGSKTTTAGVFNAANFTFTSVPGSGVGGAIVVFEDTGTDTTSRLIAYIDDYAGLPITLTGVNLNVIFPTDANKIFKI